MRPSRTLDVGLEVHQASSAVAYVAPDHGAEVTDLGTLGTRQADMDHLGRTRQSTAQPLVVVDAAGPCGYGLSRYLRHKGDHCWVVASSLLPNKAGDRVTTDRRDAVPRARLLRSGDRTPVDVPTVDEEASRDLTRAREEASNARHAAQCRLNAFWLRHAMRSTGRAPWSPAHLRGLSAVVGPTPAPPLVFPEEVRAVTAHTARLQRRAHALHAPGNAWRVPPGVEALQAWRGVPCTVAGTMVAALGALPRVAHPRPRMQCLGRMPSA
jgi:transposase